MTIPLWKLCALAMVTVMTGPGASGPSIASDAVQPPRKTDAKAPANESFVGEYAGHLLVKGGPETVDVGLEVTASGTDRYTAILYYGGLPRKRPRPAADQDKDKVELAGTYRDFTLVLTGRTPLRLQYIHGRFTVLDDKNNYAGHLTRVMP